MSNKRLCVLQVTPETPNEEHVRVFSDKEDCDFFFVTHDAPNEQALKYCPNTTWAETRNILAELVPKEYDYYAFVDYDYKFRPQRELDTLEQIIEDLQMNPAILTYYPGLGLETPYATDMEFYNSRDYSCIPFTHFGLKIIHKSLMKWFYPLCTNFSVNVDSCHMFNIQEIPFLKNVVCSHKMLYDNSKSDGEAVYNNDGAYSKYKMDQMWKWISPSFKKIRVLEHFSNNPAQLQDSLFVKNVFVALARHKNTQPEASDNNVDYYDLDRISNVFDLNHEFFANKVNNLNTTQQFETIDNHKSNIEQILQKHVTFETLKVQQNPWYSVTKKVNSEINNFRDITVNECVEVFQQMDNNEALFYKNCKLDDRLCEFLKDKTVAYVGPAPYMKGSGNGKLIDSYDVVVRIQHGIPNTEDYGAKTDIIQSCFNSNYGPPIVEHIKSVDPELRPKFVICNDTASQLKTNGEWATVDEVYTDIFESLQVPFVHLKNDDSTWDRWALYWEVYAKEHIEKHPTGYTTFSANFNSGYGALSMLLRYPLKELAVFGVDFYNGGVPQNDEQKYNKQYTDTYGVSGTPYGPDKILHDQLSQMMHCKNILLKDSRFKLDKPVLMMLNSNSISKRIKQFGLLPKFKNETR